MSQPASKIEDLDITPRMTKLAKAASLSYVNYITYPTLINKSGFVSKLRELQKVAINDNPNLDPKNATDDQRADAEAALRDQLNLLIVEQAQQDREAQQLILKATKKYPNITLLPPSNDYYAASISATLLDDARSAKLEETTAKPTLKTSPELEALARAYITAQRTSQSAGIASLGHDEDDWLSPVDRDLDADDREDALEAAQDAASAAYARLYNAAKELNQDMFPDETKPNSCAYALIANDALKKLVDKFVNDVSKDEVTLTDKAPCNIQFNTNDRMIGLAKNAGLQYIEKLHNPDGLNKVGLAAMLGSLRSEAIKENPHLNPNLVPKDERQGVEDQLRSLLNNFVAEQAKMSEKVQQAAKNYRTAPVPSDGDYYTEVGQSMFLR